MPRAISTIFMQKYLLFPWFLQNLSLLSSWNICFYSMVWKVETPGRRRAWNTMFCITLCLVGDYKCAVDFCEIAACVVVVFCNYDVESRFFSL